jgi:hypothetical protein
MYICIVDEYDKSPIIVYMYSSSDYYVYINHSPFYVSWPQLRYPNNFLMLYFVLFQARWAQMLCSMLKYLKL